MTKDIDELTYFYRKQVKESKGVFEVYCFESEERLYYLLKRVLDIQEESRHRRLLEQEQE